VVGTGIAGAQPDQTIELARGEGANAHLRQGALFRQAGNLTQDTLGVE